MIGYHLLRRAIGFAFVLLGLSVVIFTVGRVVPGDPARMALGPLATNEQVAQLREEMGFSKPAVIQGMVKQALRVRPEQVVCTS